MRSVIHWQCIFKFEISIVYPTLLITTVVVAAVLLMINVSLLGNILSSISIVGHPTVSIFIINTRTGLKVQLPLSQQIIKCGVWFQLSFAFSWEIIE